MPELPIFFHASTDGNYKKNYDEIFRRKKDPRLQKPGARKTREKPKRRAKEKGVGVEAAGGRKPDPAGTGRTKG